MAHLSEVELEFFRERGAQEYLRHLKDRIEELEDMLLRRDHSGEIERLRNLAKRLSVEAEAWMSAACGLEDGD